MDGFKSGTGDGNFDSTGVHSGVEVENEEGSPESTFVGSRDDGGGKAGSSGFDEDIDGSVGIGGSGGEPNGDVDIGRGGSGGERGGDRDEFVGRGGSGGERGGDKDEFVGRGGSGGEPNGDVDKFVGGGGSGDVDEFVRGELGSGNVDEFVGSGELVERDGELDERGGKEGIASESKSDSVCISSL